MKNTEIMTCLFKWFFFFQCVASCGEIVGLQYKIFSYFNKIQT